MVPALRNQAPHASSHESSAMQGARVGLRAGVVVAVATTLNVCAYAAFLAVGPIGSLLPTILASAFVATAVVSLVLARAYSLPSAMGGPAGNAAAVTGAALAAVVAGDAGHPERLADVRVVLALSALLPGLAMLALAAARRGRAVRFFPFPVVAGFLAGTGWLLVSGAVRMAPAPAPLAVAVACAVLLRCAFGRWKSPLAYPLVALATIVGIWIGLLASGISPEDARRAGWLFARLPAAAPAMLDAAALRAADYGAIAHAWGAFAWLVIVVVAVSMQNGAVLETETGIDERVDRDLAACGGANVLVALTGGFGSQVVLPTSLAANRLAPGSRVPGLVVAASALGGAFASASALPYLPRPAFAGIIAFYGIRFLEQYVRDASRAMSRGERAIVVTMLVATATLGLETAFVVGLALACAAFVSDAARSTIVRGETTLRHARSRVERTSSARAPLDAFGDDVPIVRFAGLLFFGSANAIETTLRPYLDREPPPEALVLDFALVRGIDVTAAAGFAKLVRRAARRGFGVAFAAVAPRVERELRANGAIGEGERAYPDLASALETYEERIVARHDGVPEAGARDALASELEPFVEAVAYGDGERAFASGDPADAMYVLVSGRFAVERDGVRLRTLLPGAFVGEMGFYGALPRSADVVAVGASVALRITPDVLARLERERPAILARVHHAVVCLQAERLRSANDDALASSL